MKKLIFKKLLVDITVFFLISSLTLGLIVWVIQAVNYMDFITEDGHSLSIYFKYTLLSLPKILSRILPFIFFISVFYNLVKLENNNELLVYWTYGVTKLKFINILFTFSLLFLLIQVLLNILIVPLTLDKGRDYIKKSDLEFFPSLIKEKKFIDTVSDLTIFVDKINNKGELVNIFLKDQIKDKESQIIHSKKGILKKQNGQNFLVLLDGEFINNVNGKITTFNFKKTNFNLSKYSTKTTTYRKIQEVKIQVLINCLKKIYFGEEYREIKDFVCNQDSLKNIKQETLKRIFKPLYIPVICLVASLLIFISKDNYNYNIIRIILFSLGMIFLITSEVSIRYSGLDDIKSLIFVATPISIIFIIYSIIFKQTLFRSNA
tara:strand:- start:620 stop:1747 length:1128 start_codon:yes stop_codon:yes gene_type:complete